MRLTVGIVVADAVVDEIVTNARCGRYLVRTGRHRFLVSQHPGQRQDVHRLPMEIEASFGLSAQGLPVAAPVGAAVRAQVNRGVACDDRVNALLLRAHTNCPVMAGQPTLADYVGVSHAFHSRILVGLLMRAHVIEELVLGRGRWICLCVGCAYHANRASQQHSCCQQHRSCDQRDRPLISPRHDPKTHTLKDYPRSRTYSVCTERHTVGPVH
jgi:hypothetical protein